MKIFNKLFLILCTLSFITTGTTYSQSNSSESLKNSVFIAPLNMFDAINPSIQIGYERKINDTFSAQIEGGIILRHSVFGFLFEAMDRGAYWYTNSGYKSRIELKYSMKDKIRFLRYSYLSGELFYTKNKSFVNDTFLISDPAFDYPIENIENYNTYDEFYTLEKQRIGLNFKFGSKFFIGKYFFVEPHIGLGLVYRNSKHFGRMNDKDELYDEVISFHNKAGKMFLPNFPYNVKLGYRF